MWSLCASLAAGPVASADSISGSQAGLVAYWKFDEGSGTAAQDASGLGNHAGALNGPVWGAGRVGGALSFDGVNDVVRDASTTFDGTGDLTVAAWVKRSGSGGHNSGRIISNTVLEFYVNRANKSLGLTCDSGRTIVESAANVLSLDAWHHVAAVRTAGGQVSFFIDGVKRHTAGVRMSGGRRDWAIGNYPSPDGKVRPFAGLIDDVRVYQRLLSEGEIHALMAAADAEATVVTAPVGPTYYLAPTGSDSHPGTAMQPWKTWAHALTQLDPGETLVVKDGTYGAATGTGYPAIDCRAGYRKGTATAPITVKAEHERNAFIDNGAPAVMDSFLIRNCSYWVIEGFYATNGDHEPFARQGGGSVFKASDSDHITFRRNLAHHNNRWSGSSSHGFGLTRVSDSLVEENECSVITRHCIIAGGTATSPSKRVTTRRNYAHSRGSGDLPGCRYNPPAGVPACTVTPDAMDSLVNFYPCVGCISENDVAEGTGEGVRIIASGPSNNRVYGLIGIETDYTVMFGPKPFDATTSLSDGNSAEQIVDVGGSTLLHFDGVTNTTVTNVMAIGGAGNGVTLFRSTLSDSRAQCNGACSAAVRNALVIDKRQRGVAVDPPHYARWSVDYANAYHNAGGNFSPASHPGITHAISLDPRLGACKVWLPAASPMKRAGKDGEDLGANILYRYEQGVLTTRPLWDPVTGQFPCGAVVRGVNDLPGQSCRDVHQRLNVNTNGCAFPEGYGRRQP